MTATVTAFSTWVDGFGTGLVDLSADSRSIPQVKGPRIQGAGRLVGGTKTKWRAAITAMQ